MRAVDGGVQLQFGSGQHDEIGVAEIGHLFVRWTNEHLTHEKGLACKLAYGEYLARESAVGTCDAVHHEHAALGQVGHGFRPDLVVVFLRDRYVHIAPCDVVVHVGCVDDEAVQGAAPGVGSGLDHEAARAGQNPLAARQGHFHQRRRTCVHRALLVGVGDAILLQFNVNCHVNPRLLG